MSGFTLVGKYSSRGDRHMILTYAALDYDDWQDREYKIEYHRMGKIMDTLTVRGYVIYREALKEQVFALSTRGGIALMDRLS